MIFSFLLTCACSRVLIAACAVHELPNLDDHHLVDPYRFSTLPRAYRALPPNALPQPTPCSNQRPIFLTKISNKLYFLIYFYSLISLYVE
jgi:hypothetical protein